MKMNVWTALAIVILFSGAVFLIPQYVKLPSNLTRQEAPTITNEVSYACADDKRIDAGFDDSIVVIQLSDGRSFTLERVPAASGAKYANEGEVVIFWTKDNGAFFEETENITYHDCVSENGGEDTPVPMPSPPPAVAEGCYIGGCSSQICSDQPDAVSTCEWNESYACYQTAKCERQTNGTCGWTKTPQLVICLGASAFR